MINTIRLNEAVLRSRFVADTGGRFADFRADDVRTFDVALDAIVAVVNTVLDSGEPGHGGSPDHQRSKRGTVREDCRPRDHRMSTGAVDGYSFGYRLLAGAASASPARLLMPSTCAPMLTASKAA